MRLGRGEIFVQFPSLGRRAPALSLAEDFHDPDFAPQGDGEHVTSLEGMGGLGDLDPVEAHTSGFDQFGGGGAMLHETGIDQPFVETLRQLNCSSSALSRP